MVHARIAIVGGGPAGSATAISLLESGVSPEDIVLVDKAAFPRPKLCGGGLTFRGTELLRSLLPELDLPKLEATDGPPGGISTIGLDFVSRAGRFPVQEIGRQWLYDRAELDHRLLTRVEQSGVRVLQQTAVRALRRSGDEWRLSTTTEDLRAQWVIGADGARSMVSRTTGLGGGRVGRLVEAYFEPTSAATPLLDRLLFDFDPVFDMIPGYAWIFPYTKQGLYKIGIMDGRGTVAGSRLRGWTDAFATRHGYRRVDDKIAGWPEHFFSPTNRASREGLILVGEAWGIDPLLGEGIAPSFEMARYAARRLRVALDRNEGRVRDYESQFRRTEPGRNLMFQHHLANLLYGSHPNRWMRVLFGHDYMRELAGGGTESYGRLAKHLPRMIGAYALQCMREGLPSAAPFPPPNAIESRGRTAS